MNRHPIRICGQTQSYTGAESASVLAAVSPAGIGAVQVGCRSGGCGVCRVRVLSGDYVTGDMSGAQVSAEERGRGVALACQLFPRGALEIEVLGRGEAACSEASPEHFRRFVALCQAGRAA